jgi:tRNA A37 methylthiotransferase MiaB
LDPIFDRRDCPAKNRRIRKTKMKYKILTFGCQMNVYDTGRIERHLGAAGYTPVETEDEADLVLLNTCAIRDSAESRVYGTLGRLAKFKRESPGRMVAVAGCMAQKEGERLVRHSKVVDVVAGTHAIPRIPALLNRAASGEGPQIDIEKSPRTSSTPPTFTRMSRRFTATPSSSRLFKAATRSALFAWFPTRAGSRSAVRLKRSSESARP